MDLDEALAHVITAMMRSMPPINQMFEQAPLLRKLVLTSEDEIHAVELLLNQDLREVPLNGELVERARTQLTNKLYVAFRDMCDRWPPELVSEDYLNTLHRFDVALHVFLRDVYTPVVYSQE